jgi:hypothetical protein
MAAEGDLNVQLASEATDTTQFLPLLEMDQTKHAIEDTSGGLTQPRTY